MANSFWRLLGKPKLILPIVLLVAVIIGAISWSFLGQPPEVTLTPLSSSTASRSATSVNRTINLAFPKAGRLASIAVGVGSVVQAGEVLASLDAGDVLGAVNQAKGALELAQAQAGSLDIQYENAKKQQNVLVANAYRTLLSSNLVAVAHKLDVSNATALVDNSQVPQISGTYTCDQTGEYDLTPYPSSVPSGYSFTFTGLESGSGSVTFYTPQALGSCGLQIQFPVGYHSDQIKWVVKIPNTESASYVANKNAYDLAVTTREQVLSQFEANLGKNGSRAAATAQAAVDAAAGAYQAAVASYRNNLIIAPRAGTVTFIDDHLKVGEPVSANKPVMTITQ